MGKAEVKALDEVYQVARQQADTEIVRLKGEIEAIREESQALGVLHKIDYDIAHNQMLKYVVLYRIKQAKEYRKGGLTWSQFCEAIGESVRTTDQILNEIRPLLGQFSARFADFSGMEFSKFRLLGRTISAESAEITEDGMVLIAGDRIPLTPDHRDDLQAALERVLDAKDEVLREKDAVIRSNERLLQSKHDLIRRQEKDLARYEDTAARKGLTADEDAFIQKCTNARVTIDGFFMDFDPERNPLPEDATPRVKAALMETLGYFKRVVDAAYDTAGDLYGDAEMDSPGWVQPNLRVVDGED